MVIVLSPAVRLNWIAKSEMAISAAATRPTRGDQTERPRR